MVRTRKAKPVEVQEPTAHDLNEADVLSITDQEVNQGTNRFLPSEEVIREFMKTVTTSDLHMKVIDALYCGDDVPAYEISYNEGFPDTEEFELALFRFLMAHLIHIETDSEIRILGLTYLLKQIIDIKEIA